MSFSEALLSMADLADDRERETTRFFAKRIDCTCLKEKYAQVKTQPKIGFFDHCHQKKKRRELMLCTRCGHVLLFRKMSAKNFAYRRRKSSAQSSGFIALKVISIDSQLTLKCPLVVLCSILHLIKLEK